MMPGKKKVENKKCRYALGRYKCRREALPGDEHCIYHSKDIKGKKDKLYDTFWKEFERQKDKEKIYDFTGFVFSEDISFGWEKFEKDCCFREAQFSRLANFRHAHFSGKASFIDTQFPEESNFEHAHFSGEADFKGTQFPGVANFVDAQFFGGAYFEDAQFSGEADFRHAQFIGGAYFMDTQFFEGAYFDDAKISEETYFEFAKFSGEASFIDTQFPEEANFEDAQFSEGADFYGSQFSGAANFRGTQFSEEAYFDDVQFLGVANFEGTQFSEAYFRSAQFSGGANFNGTKFIEDANFENITIDKCSSFDMKDTSFYNVSGLFEFIEENDKVFKKLRKRCWTLKTEFLPKNFKLVLGDGVTARYPVQSRQIKDDMYLLDKKERISKMSGIRKYTGRTLYFLWWLFADYGRSFLRWALWSFGFVIAFAFIYYSFYIDYMLNFQTVYVSEQYPFLSFLYYSIVTFTTLGFGDIVPRTGWLQLWVALEVILGYIMLGSLISILANKLARRS